MQLKRKQAFMCKKIVIFIITGLWNASALAAMEIQTPICEYTSMEDCQAGLPNDEECCTRSIAQKDDFYTCDNTDYILTLVDRCIKIDTNTVNETIVNDEGTGYRTKTTKTTRTTTCDARQVSTLPSSNCYYRADKVGNATSCMQFEIMDKVQ